MHGGDHRLREAQQPAERGPEHRALPQQLGVGHPVAFLEIGADAERALAGRAQHDRVHLPVGSQFGARLRQPVRHRCVDRVQGFGAVEHDLRHAGVPGQPLVYRHAIHTRRLTRPGGRAVQGRPHPRAGGFRS